MTESETEADIARVSRQLRFGDRDKLLFMIREIVQGRAYTSEGVSLTSGSVVLDVGANFGVAAVFFALVCEAGAVFSFEPAPETFDILRRNVESISACRVRNVGLAAQPGVAELAYYADQPEISSFFADPDRDRAILVQAIVNSGLSIEEASARVDPTLRLAAVSCEMTTVSDFIDEERLETIDLLKIDVERAELEVLAGIRNEHWKLIRQVVVEAHELAHLQAVKQLLGARGFATTTVQDPLLTGTPIEIVYALRPPG